MTTMIERIAEAICNIREPDLYGFMTERARKPYREQARAAIEAMREADNDMLEAMHNAMFANEFDATDLPMLCAGFAAAIDSALSQPKTGE